MIPPESFLRLPGLPLEVHRLDEDREITTIVGAVSLPRIAEGTMFENKWNDNFLLAVYALGELGARSLVGHTQLFADDSPVRTQYDRQNAQLFPGRIAQILYDSSVDRGQSA
jgi:hypothetical protein